MKKYIIPVTATAVLFIYIIKEITEQYISIVSEQNLFPLWDPALHSIYGWKLYNYLSQLNLPMFLWEIWSKGLWPFMYYVYQLPFYFIFGSGIESSLFSSLFGFMFIGLLSMLFLIKTDKNIPVISFGVFIMFLISSPLYLAFSSLPMTEIFGSLMQLLVFISYVIVNDSKSRKHAVLFSFSLTLLFFTKYNYFILVVISILINEYLVFSKVWIFIEHFKNSLNLLKRILSSLTGKILLLYFIFLVVLISSGGFEFNLFNQKVSVRSIGNTGYIILYFLLIRMWIKYKRGKFNLPKFLSKDFRLQPLLYYFVIPLLVWFAIPYPNHIKEFFGLVVNRQSEGFTFLSSSSFYFDILRNDYFANDIIFFAGLTVFIASLLRFKTQTQTMKWLIITVVIQVFFVVFHPYKDPRFIFLVLIPLWMIIAMELNNWITKAINSKIILYPAFIIILVFGVILFNNTVEGSGVNKYVFNYYTKSPELAYSFKVVRNQINRSDKLAVIGGISNILSPALIDWELGAPKGFKYFVGIISSDGYRKLTDATHLLIISPDENNADPEILDSFTRHNEKIKGMFGEGKLHLITESNIRELNLIFRICRIVKS